jgi:hypothetical protein
MFGLFALSAFKFSMLALIATVIASVFALINDKSKRVKWLVGAYVLLYIITYVMNYIFMFTNSMLTITTINSIMLILMGGLIGSSSFFSDKQETAKSFGYMNFSWVGGVLVLLITIIAAAITGWGSTKERANNIPITVHNSTKGAPIPSVAGKNKDIPVVNTADTVLNQIGNSLTNIPNSNVYSVDHVRAQIYKNKMYYVAPLDFDGSFFRYNHYKKVGGYFLSDATDKAASPKFVKKNMYYTPNAFFEKDVKRIIYANTVETSYTITGDTPQLEIDNQGNPFYVMSLTKRFGITSNNDFRYKAVATVNAETGKFKLYKNLKNTPKWLDVAVTPTLASEQVSLWAKFRNGWWNASGWGGAREGVMKSSIGVGSEGYDNEITPIFYKGKIYYQQSMESTKSKQTSVMGFAYTNASTGKTKYYKETSDSMTPNRAEKLSINLMKQTGWRASLPMLYNIDGKMTWVVSMLDTNYAFRNYVYMSADGNGNQGTYAMGDSATTVLENYRNTIKNGITASSTNAKEVTVSGAVNRAQVDDGKVYFVLKDSDVIYTANLDDYPMLRFINSGDVLNFKAKVSGKTGAVTTTPINNNLK